MCHERNKSRLAEVPFSDKKQLLNVGQAHSTFYLIVQMIADTIDNKLIVRSLPGDVFNFDVGCSI